MLGSDKGHTLSVVVFMMLAAASIAITFVASRRAKDASGFFVAGRRLSARPSAKIVRPTDQPRSRAGYSKPRRGGSAARRRV